MTRKTKTEVSSGYSILLVDDDVDYVTATRLLLEREGHQVITAHSGPEALSILRDAHVDLLLLDYFMPGMTGEEVVKHLRQFNPYAQVILQTGYASERPPREMLRRLDIQGYYDKSEGPEKLLLWTDVGLKSAYTVQLLYKSRQGLRYILDVTPDLHKIQPLEDLLQGILWQVAGLIGAVNSFLAVLPEGGRLIPNDVESEGFVAMMEEDTELIIRASTGRFHAQDKVEASLEKDKLDLVHKALQKSAIQIVEHSTVVPLRVGELTIGVMYLDRPAVFARDMELLQIFANQAAVAIQNSQLYEMATLDPLTGVYVRRFFDQWLVREVRTAFRSQQTSSFLLLDIDQMKKINDTAGHLAGDQALSTLGKVLRQATRGSDIVGRYGGDEFAIILPQTSADDTERVAQRILSFLREKDVAGPQGPIPLRVSIGSSVLIPHQFSAAEIPRPVPQTYFQGMAQKLVRRADQALYDSKASEDKAFTRGQNADWDPLTDAALPLPPETGSTE